jgi:peptide/nickel transport system permease protein
MLNFHFDSRLRSTLEDGAGLTFLKTDRWKSRKAKTKFFLKSFIRGWSGKVGVALLCFLILLVLSAPVLPIEDPEFIKEISLRNNPPSFEHLFGTDEWGRDMLSRTIWGAQASLLECLGALLIAMFVGAIIGFVSGYYRDQPIGYLLDRITDVFLSTPIILVALFFPIETGSLKWILAVGLSTWAIVAKIVRSQVLVTMEKPYIESARAVGASDMRIFLTCILPDIANIIAANIVYVVSIVMAIQTSLDFFGFKRFLWSRGPELPPVLIAPVISWGSLLSYNITSFLALETWWTVIPPLVCLMLLGLSLILIGNKLHEVLNPEAGTRLSVF